MEPWAIVKGTPIARNTWEGCREPEVQADPDEAANAVFVHQQQGSLSFDKLEADVRRVGKSLQNVTVDPAFRDAGQQGFLQPVAQPPHGAVFRIQVTGSQFACLSQTNDARGVLRTAPAPFLLMAPRSEMGKTAVPLRMYSTPIPLGAWSLCPEMENMSILFFFMSIGIFPVD